MLADCGRLGGKGHDGSSTSQPSASIEFVGNESQDEIVGDETARLHRSLDLDAERCPFLDISTEEVASADRVELREAREQPLALGSFTNTRCTKEDNSSSLVQSHSRRSGTFSTGREICKRIGRLFNCEGENRFRLGTVSKRLDGVWWIPRILSAFR